MSEEPIAVTSRLRRFGTSIFTEMTALAVEKDAINLGQGFPDFNGPEFVLEAAAKAVRNGPNQYSPMSGLPVMREAIARRFEIDHGVKVDPTDEVTVTPGCTGAIAAAMLGILEQGDEVILFEPWYDSYPATIEMAGASCTYVQLKAPNFRINREDIEAVITSKTRMIVVNTPHNPTGRILDEEENATIEALATKHDLIVLSDEVYEHLFFEAPHRSLLTYPGLRDRTIVASSIGKTFSLTGWKVGWTIAAPHLTKAVRSAHQFMIFSVATPLQIASAEALSAPESYFQEFRDEYRRKREILVEGLGSAGFDVIPPEGTYFALIDHTSYGLPDDRAFCQHLIDEAGVASIPVSAFHHDGDQPGGGGRNLVRFAFCKTEAVLNQAIEQLKRVQAGS